MNPMPTLHMLPTFPCLCVRIKFVFQEQLGVVLQEGDALSYQYYMEMIAVFL
jgi:hypothetical protein